MSDIRPPSGVNDLNRAQQAPNEEAGVPVRPDAYGGSRYAAVNDTSAISPFANNNTGTTTQVNVGRTMSFEELHRTLHSILISRAPFKPDVAEMMVAGAIKALSLGRGSGWVRPYVPDDDLMDLMRGGPDAYVQSLSDAYSIFEISEGTAKQRLFYELRELLYNRAHPLHELAGLYYGSLANWIRSSLRDGDRIPGGVVNIRLKNEKGFTRSVYYVSDTHGHADGLWQILQMHVSFNETLLQAMYLDKAVLVLGGDGWLPVILNNSSIIRGMVSSDALVILLSELPGNFFWTGGNHDPVVRPPEILTGGEKLIEIRNAMINGRGTGFLFDFQQVIDRLPYLALIADDDETVAIGGHTPVASITPEMAVLSPFDPAIRRMLTFGRLDSAYLDATMGPMRRAMRAPNAAFLAGHIHPRNESRSAFRPTPESRGILVMRAYGPKITGVRVASHSPTQVIVQDFVGGEKSRLHGLDLRTEVLKMNASPSSSQRRTRSCYRNPKVNYAGLPPIEVLIESWVEGIKFLWGKLKGLFSRRVTIAGMNRQPAINIRPPASNIMFGSPALMSAQIFLPAVPAAVRPIPLGMMPFVMR